jgi:hypothetical protein
VQLACPLAKLPVARVAAAKVPKPTGQFLLAYQLLSFFKNLWACQRFRLGPAKGHLGHSSCKKELAKMPPKPKAMKVLKLNLKRPAGHKEAEKNKQSMSLEEKMELFAKHKNKDANEFLDGLAKNQREALWQRFASARASLKDAEADSMWQKVAKGKGSDPAKKELLSTFLKMGGELKGKRDLWHKELITYTKSSGSLPALVFTEPLFLVCRPCQRASCPDPSP